MLNKVVVFFIVLVVSFSCKEPEVKTESNSLEEQIISDTNLDWMPGVWIDSTSFKVIGQTYVESWEKRGADSFVGWKYAIKNGKNGDTTNLKIEKTEGIYYLSVGKGKEKSVFLEQGSTKEIVRFSNTKDEFPYTINYTYNKDKLLITVSGSLKGENREIKYNTLRQ